MNTWASPVRKTTLSMPARSISPSSRARSPGSRPSVAVRARCRSRSGDHDLVGDDLPARLRGLQRVMQPAHLRLAEHAARLAVVAAGAVLALVGQEEVGVGAERELAGRRGGGRCGDDMRGSHSNERAVAGQRRASGVGAGGCRCSCSRPRGRPRCARHGMQAVQLAQARIAAVERVLRAVGGQVDRVDLVVAQGVLARPGLVDVVAEEDVEVEVGERGRVGVRAEVAARRSDWHEDEREQQRLRRAGGPRGAGAADRARRPCPTPTRSSTPCAA